MSARLAGARVPRVSVLRRCHRAWPRSGREGARHQAQVTPHPASIFQLEAKEGGGIPPRCFQKNRRGRVSEPGLGCVARARVLRRADLDAASDARRGPWRPSSSRAVEARAAPRASKMRKQDAADDPRDPADRCDRLSGAHQSSSSDNRWQRDREGQRPQQSGCPRECLSSSQIRPCDEIGVGRPRHWHSVRRVAHGPIVARHAPSASERPARLT